MLASSEGLEGITIGSVASRVSMSKAGIVGPFGSREALQEAALRRAVEVFVTSVAAPAIPHEPGLARLRVVVDSWIGYLADSPFPNGCFMTAVSSEIDGQPGPLCDIVKESMGWFLGFLREEVAAAVDAHELNTDPDDVVLTLFGLAAALNQELQLFGRTESIARIRRLMHAAVEP
ncbi:TetR/AcrR family transcriptional regulator [Smaragdicoccus niigatensis]